MPQWPCVVPALPPLECSGPHSHAVCFLLPALKKESLVSEVWWTSGTS